MNDKDFLIEIIAQICNYAVDNDMNPTETIRIVATNILMLTEIASFDNWERGENE